MAVLQEYTYQGSIILRTCGQSILGRLWPEKFGLSAEMVIGMLEG